MPEVIVADAMDLAAVRELWTEYWASAGLDPQFQGFAEELAALPGSYSPPAGRPSSSRSSTPIQPRPPPSAPSTANVPR
jgi:hypothetical protein